MLTFKKIAAVLLTASPVFASASAITIPDEPNAWGIGAYALYLQPSFGGNGLGYSSFSNYGTDFYNVQREVNGAPNHLTNVRPKRDWGFEVEGSYDFGRGNDINVNWYHLNNNTHGQLPMGTLFAGSASSLYAGLLNVSPRWDAINIEIGQSVKFCDLQTLRLHGGVEFARVKNTFTNYPRLTANADPVFITKDEISYSGFGPRLGVDYTFATACGFGLYAKAAGSLLVGKAKQSVTGYHDLGGFNLYSTGNYNQSNSSVVVTELEGKLGLKYDYRFGCGNLKADVGYMWVTYLNSLVSQVGSGEVSSSISNSAAANFDLNGVYFGLTWTGNA